MIKPTARKVSRNTSIQAPTGGLNAKDAIANMKETEAVVMDNFFPSPSSVDLRNGYASHATGLPDLVETLADYNNGATQKIFAVSDGSIYDVTSAGAVGGAAVSGLASSRFQFINMGTAGGYYLMMVNGADKLRYYNGSAWDFDGNASLTITGVNTENIVHINNFKNRVWLIEKDSFNAWYLPVSSIAGAANNLDLSGLFSQGGYLMAMANWTIDNAAGIDDYAAFITSEGEVAIYKGTDPNSSSTWALVGTFRMGRPIGRRCFCKAGADVLVLTTDGAFPLSKALLSDRSQLNLAATDKISNLINIATQNYSGNFGWEPILHTIGKKLIINVPVVEGQESIQYVMNTTHGAWCRFTGWNANCFQTLADTLYFGGNGVVYKADTGDNDDGANIEATCQQAFSYFGNAGATKHWKMARCNFIGDGNITPSILISTDFSYTRTTVPPSYVDNVGAFWDVGAWDVSSWTVAGTVVRRWQTITGIGYSGGIRLDIASKGIRISWQSTDFVYEVGGTL